MRRWKNPHSHLFQNIWHIKDGFCSLCHWNSFSSNKFGELLSHAWMKTSSVSYFISQVMNNTFRTPLRFVTHVFLFLFFRVTSLALKQWYDRSKLWRIYKMINTNQLKTRTWTYKIKRNKSMCTFHWADCVPLFTQKQRQCNHGKLKRKCVIVSLKFRIYTGLLSSIGS